MRFLLFSLLIFVALVANSAALTPPQNYNLCSAHSDCRYFGDDCFCGLGTDGLKHCYCIGTLQ